MNTIKLAVILPVLGLLVACAPMSPLSTTQHSSSDLNHNALAKQYEKLAREMEAKAQQQKAVLKHKPRSSYFGKNGQHIKSHVAYKVRGYKQAAQENLEKAAYHRKIAAEQAHQKSIAKPNQTSDQINKARIRNDDSPALPAGKAKESL